MSSGSKECLRSMLRAHSRGQNAVFYRKRKEQHNVVCFGVRSDQSKVSANLAERETEDEFDDEGRSRSRDDDDDLSPSATAGSTATATTTTTTTTPSSAAAATAAADKTAHNQYLVSTENENVAPGGPVQLPLKRKSVSDEPPPKRSLRPKPQRTSDDRSSLSEAHASASTSLLRSGNRSPNSVFCQDDSANFSTTTAAVSTTTAANSTTTVTATATAPKVVVKRGFLTLREMLVSHIEPYGLKLSRRPQKKTSMSQQLEDSKKSIIDIETPDSILVGLNIKEILNIHSFKLLPKNYQHKLLSLLPPVDRKNDGNIETALNNEFFASACQEWRERLSDGELTPENQTKLKSEYEKLLRCVDPWKMKHFEDSWGRSPYENSLIERQRFQKMRELHEKMLESKRKKQEEDKLIETATAAAAAAAASAAVATATTTSASLATATATSAADKLDGPTSRTSHGLPSSGGSTINTTSLRASKQLEVESSSKVSSSAQKNTVSSKDSRETRIPLPAASSPTTQSVSSKTKREAEDKQLLQGEEKKYALLLPHYSSSLHRVLAEHGVPISSNHRKKCNNLVPLSMCFSAKRVATSSLAPPKCFLSSPLVIPRRHLRFYHYQSRRVARAEQANREVRTRCEQELQVLDEHLKRLEAFLAKPIRRMLPVPNDVQELVDEMVNLVESDRIHEYNSYATSSYATSTMGTPSHGGTTLDENFGSELMFSVATDEEPPTDMSDESRPQTAFDNDVVMTEEGDDVDDDLSEGASSRQQKNHGKTTGDEGLQGQPKISGEHRSAADEVRRQHLVDDDEGENSDSLNPNVSCRSSSSSCCTTNNKFINNGRENEDDDEIEVKIEAALSEDDTREATTPELPQLSQQVEQGEQGDVSMLQREFNDEDRGEESCQSSPCTNGQQQASAVADDDDDEDDELVESSEISNLLEVERKDETLSPKPSEENQSSGEGEVQNYEDERKDEQVVESRLAETEIEKHDEECDADRFEPMDSKSLQDTLKDAPSETVEKCNDTNNDESGSVICEILDEDCGSDHSDNEPKNVGQAANYPIENKERTPQVPSAGIGEIKSSNPVRKSSVGTLEDSVQTSQLLGNTQNSLKPCNSQLETNESSMDVTKECSVTSEQQTESVKSGNLHSLPKETGELPGENHQQIQALQRQQHFASSKATTSSMTTTTTTTTAAPQAQTATSTTNTMSREARLIDCENEIKMLLSSSSPPSSSDSTLSDEDTDIDSSSGLQQTFDNNNDGEDTASDSTIEEVSLSPHQSKEEKQLVQSSSSSPSSSPPLPPSLLVVKQEHPQSKQNAEQQSQQDQSTSEICSNSTPAKEEKDDTSGRPASFVTGGLVAPPLPPRCRAQASGYSNRRRRRALSCRDLLIAVEQRKKGQQKNGSPCCLQDGNRGEHSKGCFCKLQPMLPCQRCGAFWHSDCIGPSRICSTCLLV